MYSPADLEYMTLALAQARKSLFISNPNPRVGCVLVKDGEIIGIGHTQAPGGAHAEISALKDAAANGFDPEGATAYVTLEPCCHHGRTPPCTDALIAAKIARVVAAMEDPNPLVAGHGIALLKEAAIEVRCGLFEKEAQDINPGFIKRMRSNLPWVRMKMAASLDGTTALHDGQSQWITGPAARMDGHRWRAQACAILTGIGTVAQDDPQMNVRGIETPRQPLRVVIDSQLAIPLESKILIGGNTLIVCANPDAEHFEKMHHELLARGVSLISLPNEHGKVDLIAVLQFLAEHYQINEVHVEAGSKLSGSLIKEGCVDELLLYLSPCLLGPGIGLASLAPLASLDDRYSWKFIEQTLIEDDLRLRLLAIR